VKKLQLNAHYSLPLLITHTYFSEDSMDLYQAILARCRCAGMRDPHNKQCWREDKL
jgi:hypothetical protein